MNPFLAVVVVRGRTRSLVERFERRESVNSNEDQASTMPRVIPEMDITLTVAVKFFPSE